MKAAVFVEPGRIELREKPIPEIGPDDALVRVTTTTICGTDIHIRKGDLSPAPVPAFFVFDATALSALATALASRNTKCS